jgi:hypothetical protein
MRKDLVVAARNDQGRSEQGGIDESRLAQTVRRVPNAADFIVLGVSGGDGAELAAYAPR